MRAAKSVRTILLAVALMLPAAIWLATISSTTSLRASEVRRSRLAAPPAGGGVNFKPPAGELIPGLGTLIGPVGSTSPSAAGNVLTEIPFLVLLGHKRAGVERSDSGVVN